MRYLFSSAISLIGLPALVLGAPADITTTITTVTPPSTTCPTLCIDGINSCGTWWGGCINVCTGTLPTAPPCTATTTSPAHSTTVTVPPLTTSPSPPPSSTSTYCRPRTLCVDYVNKCGMKYGGCYDTCSGKASDFFTAPPCPYETYPPPRI